MNSLLMQVMFVNVEESIVRFLLMSMVTRGPVIVISLICVSINTRVFMEESMLPIDIPEFLISVRVEPVKLREKQPTRSESRNLPRVRFLNWVDVNLIWVGEVSSWHWCWNRPKVLKVISSKVTWSKAIR